MPSECRHTYADLTANYCESALNCYLKGLLFAGMKFARILPSQVTLVNQGDARKMFHFYRQAKKKMSCAANFNWPVQHVDNWQPWLSVAVLRESGAPFANHNADWRYRLDISLIAWFKRLGVSLPC